MARSSVLDFKDSDPKNCCICGDKMGLNELAYPPCSTINCNVPYCNKCLKRAYNIASNDDELNIKCPYCFNIFKPERFKVKKNIIETYIENEFCKKRRTSLLDEPKYSALLQDDIIDLIYKERKRELSEFYDIQSKMDYDEKELIEQVDTDIEYVPQLTMSPSKYSQDNINIHSKKMRSSLAHLRSLSVPNLDSDLEDLYDDDYLKEYKKRRSTIAKTPVIEEEKEVSLSGRLLGDDEFPKINPIFQTSNSDVLPRLHVPTNDVNNKRKYSDPTMDPRNNNSNGVASPNTINSNSKTGKLFPFNAEIIENDIRISGSSTNLPNNTYIISPNNSSVRISISKIGSNNVITNNNINNNPGNLSPISNLSNKNYYDSDFGGSQYTTENSEYDTLNDSDMPKERPKMNNFTKSDEHFTRETPAQKLKKEFRKNERTLHKMDKKQFKNKFKKKLSIIRSKFKKKSKKDTKNRKRKGSILGKKILHSLTPRVSYKGSNRNKIKANKHDIGRQRAKTIQIMSRDNTNDIYNSKQNTNHNSNNSNNRVISDVHMRSIDSEVGNGIHFEDKTFDEKEINDILDEVIKDDNLYDNKPDITRKRMESSTTNKQVRFSVINNDTSNTYIKNINRNNSKRHTDSDGGSSLKLNHLSDDAILSDSATNYISSISPSKSINNNSDDNILTTPNIHNLRINPGLMVNPHKMNRLNTDSALNDSNDNINSDNISMDIQNKFDNSYYNNNNNTSNQCLCNCVIL